MQQPSHVGFSLANEGLGLVESAFSAITATAAASCCTDVYAPKRRIDSTASATASWASASVRAFTVGVGEGVGAGADVDVTV